MFFKNKKIDTKEIEIQIVMGRICSGKDFFINNFQNKENKYFVITISKILQEITGLKKRSKLLMTENLKGDIYKILRKQIIENKKVIVNGIRQIEILEYILKDFDGAKIQMYWVVCSDSIRKQRFEERRSEKDDLSFEEADERDNKMAFQIYHQ